MKQLAARARVWLAVVGGMACLSCAGDLGLEPCDIRKSACQRDVFMAVQDVRGSLWDPWLEVPPMRVIGTQQYRAELEAAREWALQADRPYDYLTPALKLLHMIDPEEPPDGQTDFTLSFVAAYYDAVQRSVTIIDRGSGTDLRADVRTLAHELVHAAQERDIGFASFDTWISSLDTANATGSLIEGEAMLYENLVDAKLRSLDVSRIEWDEYHASWIAGTREQIAMDPSPFRLASSGLRYPLGSAYLTDAFLEGAQLGVRRALTAHPDSTARLMAGRKSRDDRPAAAWSCSQPEAPPGHGRVRDDELGAFSLYAFATRLFPDDDARAWSLASAWNGDRFFIYATPEKQLAVLWMLRMRTPDDARLLREALAQSSLGASVQSELEGERLQLFVAQTDLGDFASWRTCSAPL